ncbi:MAG: PTS sugar transporter subunit IIC [Bacilli bacterium]
METSENQMSPETVNQLPPENKKPNKILSFLKKVQNNLAKTTNGMAIGLFGTLIIGTIIGQLAKIHYFSEIAAFATVIKGLMGAGIGLGVALSLKRSGVTMVTSIAAGAIGNLCFNYTTCTVDTISDPLSCYVSACVALLAIKYIMRKKTPVDMILIPLVGLLASMIYATLLGTFVHSITLGLGKLIEISFDAVPLLMCVIVSVLVGMALTAPISSVAICVAINIGNVPLAAGAAVIGCCVQMVGFAVETAYDNKIGSILAVGFGTSMLQFKNIVKKPLIWLPTIIVSAILGPFALLFGFTSTSVGAGMGTSGLVGLLESFASLDYRWDKILLLITFTVIIPIILVFAIDLLFRKIGWIKKGDFSLDNDL